MIDVATLTGACVIALGPLCAGLMANDQALARAAAGRGRAGGRARVAAAAHRRVPRGPQERGRRPQQRRPARRRRHHRRPVPQGVRGRARRGPTSTSRARPSARSDLPLSPKGGTGATVRTLLTYLTADECGPGRPSHPHPASDGTLAPRELVPRRSSTASPCWPSPTTIPPKGSAKPWRRRAALRDHDRARARDQLRRGRGGDPRARVLVDHQAPWFQEFLREQRAERAAPRPPHGRAPGRARNADRSGRGVGPGRGGSPGRPHVAQVMVKRGYVKSVREAFDKYLRAGGPANVAAPSADADRGGRGDPSGPRRAGAGASRARGSGRHDSRPRRGGTPGHRGVLRRALDRAECGDIWTCADGSTWWRPAARTITARRAAAATRRGTPAVPASWEGESEPSRPAEPAPGRADGPSPSRSSASRTARTRARRCASSPSAACPSTSSNLDERPAARGELRRFQERFGAAALIDRESPRFRALGLHVSGDSPERLLSARSTSPGCSARRWSEVATA